MVVFGDDAPLAYPPVKSPRAPGVESLALGATVSGPPTFAKLGVSVAVSYTHLTLPTKA